MIFSPFQPGSPPQNFKMALVLNFPKRMTAASELAREFRNQRDNGMHAMILVGSKPRWVDSFRKNIRQLYKGQSAQVIQGLVDILEGIFGYHPTDYARPDKKLSEMQDLQEMEISVEKFIEKINELAHMDVSEWPEYRTFFRLYCFLVCHDTIDPIKEMAVNILITIKKQKRDIFVKLASNTNVLSEAIQNRKRARDVDIFIGVAKRYMYPEKRRYRKPYENPPSMNEMSPVLKSLFKKKV